MALGIDLNVEIKPVVRKIVGDGQRQNRRRTWPVCCSGHGFYSDAPYSTGAKSVCPAHEEKRAFLPRAKRCFACPITRFALLRT